MTETGTIAVAITLALCALAFVGPSFILVIFWRLNEDYRRVLKLVPAYAGRYDMRLLLDTGDWFGKWPRAVGDCGDRAISLETISTHWYHRHRGMRLNMAVNELMDFSLQALFPPDLPRHWQRKQEEGWSPLDEVLYSSHPVELGEWLFIKNEMLDLKLEEHLSRLYQLDSTQEKHKNEGLEMALFGETGRLWINFPDTRPTVNQLVIATQILEKFAAALESGEFYGPAQA